jgi:hypothetical protein
VRWPALADVCVRCWRGAVGGGSGPWSDRLPRLRRAAGAPGARTRAAGADAARRSPAAAPAGGLPSVREDARAACGVVCAAPARRDRGDDRRVAGRRRRPKASHDRRAAGPSAGHGARLAAARPSPRGRDPPAGQRGVVRARAAGVRARSPGGGKPARRSSPRTRKSAASWTTLPARGRGFPVKTAEFADDSSLGGVGESARPRPKHQRGRCPGELPQPLAKRHSERSRPRPARFVTSSQVENQRGRAGVLVTHLGSPPFVSEQVRALVRDPPSCWRIARRTRPAR